MRQSCFSLLVVLSLASVSVATAQTTPRTVGVSVSGGLAQPIGASADVANTGYNLGAALWLRPAARFSLRGELSYDRLSLDAGSEAEANGIKAHTRAIGGSVSGIYRLSPNRESLIRPYLLGGLGLYNVKDVVSYSGDALESPGMTKLGIHGGVGLDMRLSGFNAFVEARVQNIFTDGRGLNTSRQHIRYVPIVFGVRF
ncbi:MAG: outer membrane beta-barrel protein [Gemmatimonadaceae bacterium]|nr:outer membrane beta-barrel protein [Gemmatimonadaceae bacterium]